MLAASIRRTVVEVIVLGVMGLALGFGTNAVRGSGSIKVARNYFFAGAVSTSATPAALEDGSSPTGGLAGDAPANATEAAHTTHCYQDMSFEEVAEVFKDACTQMGGNLFIDARKSDAFTEGHIPGAIQADHYRLEEYVDKLLALAGCADRIIVYCHGGACEDSIFLCADLIELEVPYDAIYLFSGGWEEWVKKGMPIEKGRAR